MLPSDDKLKLKICTKIPSLMKDKRKIMNDILLFIFFSLRLRYQNMTRKKMKQFIKRI